MIDVHGILTGRDLQLVRTTGVGDRLTQRGDARRVPRIGEDDGRARQADIGLKIVAAKAFSLRWLKPSRYVFANSSISRTPFVSGSVQIMAPASSANGTASAMPAPKVNFAATIPMITGARN